MHLVRNECSRVSVWLVGWFVLLVYSALVEEVV